MQTAQEGVQLFSLAVLLSSTFVFNQMGPIDEAALDRLSLVTNITRHIRVTAHSDAAGGWRAKGKGAAITEKHHALHTCMVSGLAPSGGRLAKRRVQAIVRKGGGHSGVRASSASPNHIGMHCCGRR